MAVLRSGLLNALPQTDNFKTNGVRVGIKVEFSPAAVGANKKNGQYPPTVKITENQIETELLKHFGFDVNNPTDLAHVKELLKTSDNPFSAIKTTGTLVAVYNKSTGKYEAVDYVDKKLLAELQGKAAQIKQQIENEKTPTAPTDPNDLIAVKNGIANNRRAELENKLRQNNTPSISAPDESKQAVQKMTDTIAAITGTTDWENAGQIGKQFNRLGVSTVRLSGKVMELTNYFSEKINGAIRYFAPDSVDEMLNKTDALNRETAIRLQQANSAVTSEDAYIDAKAKEQNREIPVAEDLANKAMYFPEGIPNAIDSAIRGDFKDDDDTYSDRVGKIIGGLNPVGDVRDIIADGKRVHDGEKGAWIKLGGTIIGAVPIVGDVGKVLVKSEEKAIVKILESGVEKEVEKEAVKIGGETGEKILVKESEKIAEENIEDFSIMLANKESKLVHTPREEALQELLTEARKGNIYIHSDEEAQKLLDWAASREGVSPENYHAVTIGDDIFVRKEYVENVRVLREELIHVFQQRSGIGTDKIVEAEIEARLKMIMNRHKWGLTNDEIREMIREIRQIRKTGKY